MSEANKPAMETRAAQKKAETVGDSESTELKMLREREKRLREECEKLRAGNEVNSKLHQNVNALVAHVNNIASELKNIRTDVTRIQQDRSNAPIPSTSGFSEMSTPRKDPGNETMIRRSPTPQDNTGDDDQQAVFNFTPLPTADFALKNAVEALSMFNGNNMSVLTFIRSVKQARDTVPPQAEPQLVKHIIMHKLKGLAQLALEDENCFTADKLCEILRQSFGPKRTLEQYRGDMTGVYQKLNEHVLEYICRVKDLRTAILNSKKQETGSLTALDIAEIDSLTRKSFCRGFPPDMRKQISQYEHCTLQDLYSKARELYGEYELDCERYGAPRYTRESTPRKFQEKNAPRQRDNCAYCGRLGHHPEECWYKNGDSQQYRQPAPRNNNFKENNYNNGNRNNYFGSANPNRTQQNYGPNNGNRFGGQQFFDGGARNQFNRGNVQFNRGNYGNNFARNENANSYYRGGMNPQKICAFCNYSGHVIEECRKRQNFENQNAVMQNEQPRNSGNYQGPPRTSGANREAAQGNARQINAIETTEEILESQ